MKRITFLKHATVFASGVVAPGWWRINEELPKESLQIIHTNDTLGHVEPLGKTAGTFEGMGGMSRRASAIQKMRKRSPELILLDAGNVAGDSIYTDRYGMGLIYEMMSHMKYDASTLGEKDLSRGRIPLMDALRTADFPVVVSNYKLDDHRLRRLLQRYHILKRKGLRIGIFGLGADPEGCGRDVETEIDYRDPKLISEAMVRKLRYHEECDVIICLSRLGIENTDNGMFSDLRLAREVAGIDMIIGGPDRIPMDQARMVKGSTGSASLVTQAGYGGMMLGKSTLTRNGTKSFKYFSTSRKLQ